jgi:hypothetical protein
VVPGSCQGDDFTSPSSVSIIVLPTHIGDILAVAGLSYSRTSFGSSPWMVIVASS